VTSFDGPDAERKVAGQNDHKMQILAKKTEYNRLQ
jgi:hypothetical protein